MTTTTVFAATNDAYIQSQDATYSNAADGLGAFTVDTTGTTAYTGQRNPAVHRCYAGYLDFDTSSIPDTDVVSAVVLSLKGIDDGSVQNFTVEVYPFDFGATVTSADWQTPAQIGALSMLASIPSTSYSTGYMDFTSTAAFLTAVNKTGNTRLIMVSDRFRTGTAAANGVDEYLGWVTANTSGTTSDPKLVVTHAAPTQPLPMRLNY